MTVATPVAGADRAMNDADAAVAGADADAAVASVGDGGSPNKAPARYEKKGHAADTERGWAPPSRTSR